jgi:hypothetical protein
MGRVLHHHVVEHDVAGVGPVGGQLGGLAGGDHCLLIALQDLQYLVRGRREEKMAQQPWLESVHFDDSRGVEAQPKCWAY